MPKRKLEVGSGVQCWSRHFEAARHLSCRLDTYLWRVLLIRFFPLLGLIAPNARLVIIHWHVVACMSKRQKYCHWQHNHARHHLHSHQYAVRKCGEVWPRAHLSDARRHPPPQRTCSQDWRRSFPSHHACVGRCSIPQAGTTMPQQQKGSSAVCAGHTHSVYSSNTRSTDAISCLPSRSTAITCTWLWQWGECQWLL